MSLGTAFCLREINVLVILITAPTLVESRRQQDLVLEYLGEDSVAPILFVEYVAVRVPVTLVAFCNRYVGKLADSEYDFVLCDDPLEEATRRARY
jgi:hypothetical protein